MVPTAATFVDNVEINGGFNGVTVQDNHTEVTNSDISGVRNGVFYFGTLVPHTGRVEGSIFECGNFCVGSWNDGDIDVISNTFGECGSGRCVMVFPGARVEVRSNTFAAAILTGELGPDLNQVINFRVGTSGLIDSNIFEGCGFVECGSAPRKLDRVDPLAL